MKYGRYAIWVWVIAFAFACHQRTKNEKIHAVKIEHVFQTARNEADNIDSPAVWHAPDGRHRLITTAKEGHSLLVYDASTGEYIRRIGQLGHQPGEFNRPNGILVIDDLVFVVERDNQRVQILRLPNFDSLGFLGDDLRKPYGIWGHRIDQTYHVYVTDNYESENDQIPPDAELGDRVHYYTMGLIEEKPEWTLMRAFGDTSGEGVLRVVESIYGDPANGKLLIAEEDERNTCVKVYDFDGAFTGTIIGKGLLKGQAEGIALYETSDTDGYWVLTDQSHTANYFLLFDRATFEYVGAFFSPNTTNTDGICLTQHRMPNFQAGAFYAVHNDGNVSAFDWYEIAKALRLETAASE